LSKEQLERETIADLRKIADTNDFIAADLMELGIFKKRGIISHFTSYFNPYEISNISIVNKIGRIMTKGNAKRAEKLMLLTAAVNFICDSKTECVNLVETLELLE